MSRKGPLPTHPNRRDITLRCDADVYAEARALMEYMPGLALSDVVEDFLRTLIKQMTPLRIAAQQLLVANPDASRDEIAAMVEVWAAQVVGQGTLEFTRAADAFRSGKDDDG